MADKIPTKKGSNKIDPKNLVKIGRLKQIIDSLRDESISKLGEAMTFATTGGKISSKKYFEKAAYDKRDADRYEDIIKKKEDSLKNNK